MPRQGAQGVRASSRKGASSSAGVNFMTTRPRRSKNVSPSAPFASAVFTRSAVRHADSDRPAWRSARFALGTSKKILDTADYKRYHPHTIELSHVTGMVGGPRGTWDLSVGRSFATLECV